MEIETPTVVFYKHTPQSLQFGNKVDEGVHVLEGRLQSLEKAVIVTQDTVSAQSFQEGILSQVDEVTRDAIVQVMGIIAENQKLEIAALRSAIAVMKSSPDKASQDAAERLKTLASPAQPQPEPVTLKATEPVKNVIAQPTPKPQSPVATPPKKSPPSPTLDGELVFYRRSEAEFAELQQAYRSLTTSQERMFFSGLASFHIRELFLLESTIDSYRDLLGNMDAVNILNVIDALKILISDEVRVARLLESSPEPYSRLRPSGGPSSVLSDSHELLNLISKTGPLSDAEMQAVRDQAARVQAGLEQELTTELQTAIKLLQRPLSVEHRVKVSYLNPEALAPGLEKVKGVPLDDLVLGLTESHIKKIELFQFLTIADYFGFSGFSSDRRNFEAVRRFHQTMLTDTVRLLDSIRECREDLPKDGPAFESLLQSRAPFLLRILRPSNETKNSHNTAW